MADLGYCTVLNRRHVTTDFHSVYLAKSHRHVEVCRQCNRTTEGVVIKR